jgi:hypothetical protein
MYVTALLILITKQTSFIYIVLGQFLLPVFQNKIISQISAFAERYVLLFLK